MTQGCHGCQLPTPANDLLAEFWKIEKDVAIMLEGLAG